MEMHIEYKTIQRFFFSGWSLKPEKVSANVWLSQSSVDKKKHDKYWSIISKKWSFRSKMRSGDALGWKLCSINTAIVLQFEGLNSNDPHDGKNSPKWSVLEKENHWIPAALHHFPPFGHHCGVTNLKLNHEHRRVNGGTITERKLHKTVERFRTSRDPVL